MKTIEAIRKNIFLILTVLVFLIAPGVLFAAAGMAAMQPPCNVSTLNALPLMLFFMSFIAVGGGVLLVVDGWKK